MSEAPPLIRRSGPARALIIEQGGVRGMQPAVYMEMLEEMLGCPIAHEFDLVAFTSTGQIAGSIVVVPDPERPGYPKFPAAYGVASYEEFAISAFPNLWNKTMRQIVGEAKYDGRPLEERMDAAFGDTRVRECVTSVMYYVNEVETGAARCIRSIRDREGNVIEEYNASMKISDVTRAGISAPTILSVKDYPVDPDDPAAGRKAYMDAAVAGGNVPHEVWHMLGRIAPGEERMIVCLGTGETPLKPMTPQKYNLRGVIGFLMGPEKREHFLSMTFNAAADASRRFMKKMMGPNFMVLNAGIDAANPAHPSHSIDDGNAENMRRHRVLAESHFLENRAQFAPLLALPRAEVIPAPEKSGVRNARPSNDNAGAGLKLLKP